MKIVITISVIGLFFLSTFFINCNDNNESKAEKKNSSNFVHLDPIEAMNNPSKHAWDLFLYVNHPAKSLTLGRGIPDSARNIGDSGLVVWETWKHAGTEVFLPDGSKPPPWDDYSLDPYLNKKSKTFDSSTAALFVELKKVKDKGSLFEISNEFVQEMTKAHFNPDDGLIGTGGEARMNKSTFDFIMNKELYNENGLIKFRDNYLKTPIQNRKPLNFEKESIEVKGMWKKFTEQELKDKLDKKYYVAIDGDGIKYGLTSLHIITKEIPNWFWCSFRHKDGPTPQIPSKDDYGQPKELKGTFWENHELSGTQTEFTDSRGKPTRLSDPFIEKGFENSSCITCHATSVIGPDGGGLLFTMPEVYEPGKIFETMGTPKEKWYLDSSGNEKYIQLDFVYSLSFRTQKKN